MITKPRRESVAIILSVLCPGLGHFYSGDAFRGVAVVLLGYVLAALYSVMMLWSAGWLAISVVLALGFYGAVVWDVTRLTKRNRATPLKRYQRWYVFVLIFVAIQIPAQTILKPGLQSFNLPSSSMAPTLLDGDYFFADTKAYNSAPPQLGDVVVFVYPKDPQLLYVKRIVGLPGDTIEIRNKKVFVNGKAQPIVAVTHAAVIDAIKSMKQLKEPVAYDETLGKRVHRVVHDRAIEMLADFEKTTVAAGHYFVLGDNRDYSNDSRFWGDVASHEIIGKVKYVYFSMVPETHKIRIGRIGAQIE